MRELRGLQIVSPRTSVKMSDGQLKREVGVFGAILMGLGSIIGTGVFVSVGFAAGVAGSLLLPAIMLACFLALCNALSSAQLAASHPVSGGTYEYGYRYLNPLWGFVAGWMFLWAKSASAAAAAMGLAAYLGLDVWAAFAAVAVLTILVRSGIRRTNLTNIAIVSVTILSLIIFAVGAWPHCEWSVPTLESSRDLADLFQATALMFVAYTGYGRIATLGEEVREPAITIPKAIIGALFTSAFLYLLIGAVIVGTGSGAAEAPLQEIASGWVRQVVSVGAVTAMIGVLLNLILGLSRVLLAMGRRGDMPGFTARINEAGSPTNAVVVMGCVVGGLVGLGSVKLAWSFSAFTVLLYYAITNLASLKLGPEDRRFPKLFSWLGLAGCLFLAFWVEMEIWAAGLGVLAVGLVYRQLFRSATTTDQ